MGWKDRIELEDLDGEVLTHIDVDSDDKKGDQILLTTQSGRQIRIYHEQDCCEHVRIEGTDGEWRELYGKPILEAVHEEDGGEWEGGTCTRTTLTFRVDSATVISRWFGESNGYYSEAVNIEDITRKQS